MAICIQCEREFTTTCFPTVRDLCPQCFIERAVSQGRAGDPYVDVEQVNRQAMNEEMDRLRQQYSVAVRRFQEPTRPARPINIVWDDINVPAGSTLFTEDDNSISIRTCDGRWINAVKEHGEVVEMTYGTDPCRFCGGAHSSDEHHHSPTITRLDLLLGED